MDVLSLDTFPYVGLPSNGYVDHEISSTVDCKCSPAVPPISVWNSFPIRAMPVYCKSEPDNDKCCPEV